MVEISHIDSFLQTRPAKETIEIIILRLNEINYAPKKIDLILQARRESNIIQRYIHDYHQLQVPLITDISFRRVKDINKVTYKRILDFIDRAYQLFTKTTEQTISLENFLK